MLTGMLHLHNVLRYLIIIVAVWAIVAAFMGKSKGKSFVKKDKTPGMLFMIFMDVQLLIGLILYFVGPYGFKRISELGFGGVMKESVSRFFAVEHIFGMIVALVLVHIGYATSKKAMADNKKFSKMAWMYLIAFLIILITIPWPFRDLGRGWMPGMKYL